MSKYIIDQWFKSWETGNFKEIPVTENFTHTSPYGTIKGKQAYLDLVAAHTDKFLGHEFIIHDVLCESQQACVRYTTIKENFQLEVSEWYFFNNNLIETIIAYYNIPDSNQETLDYPKHS